MKLAETNLAIVFGPEMDSIQLPLLPGVNGPDDFVASQGDAAFWKLWDAPAGQPKAASDLAIILNDLSMTLSAAVAKASRILLTQSTSSTVAATDWYTW